jgi:hypothetical protein
MVGAYCPFINFVLIGPGLRGACWSFDNTHDQRLVPL